MLSIGQFKYIDKNAKVLVIVESPNKVKTINNISEFKALLTTKKCSNCGEPLIIRQSRFGKFLGYSNYPTCGYTENIVK